MPRSGRPWELFLRSAAVALACSGCISARLVTLENVERPLPARHARWRSELRSLLDAYERAPVLVPEDERLEPLYGGLTTLGYFGVDAAPRVADQQIPADARARAATLSEVCAAPNATLDATVLETTGLPRFEPVWIPLAADGGEPPAAASCGPTGEPSGAAAGEVFCLYARVALQPEKRRTLVVVVHGLFDSGAQAYLQRMAAELYRLGHAVLLPDLRDHGQTLRAAPPIATTLGTVEGRDLLAVVRSARAACGDRIARTGLAGVSGGGLAVIRAFTDDREGTIDAGAIALSPLLDVRATIADLDDTAPCPLTRTIELSWFDTALVTAVSGAAFFGGAAVVQALSGEVLDGTTAATSGIGAGVGLLGALAVDQWFDGGSEPCLAEHAIAHMVEGALRVRWRALREPALGPTMSAAGRSLAPESISIDDYVRERVQFSAARLGIELRTIDARSLTRELGAALAAPGRAGGRLLVLGAADDPVTRAAAFRAFVAAAARIAQVFAHEVEHGGHGAMWIVQPTITRRIFARFFEPDEAPPRAR